MFVYVRVLIVLYSLLSPVAHASQRYGHEVGNGGDVIACENSPYEVLDYYMYRQSPGRPGIDLGPGDEFEKVHRVLDRLKRVDPLRADRYLRRFDQIWPNDVTWIANFEMMDIPDAGYIPTKKCNLHQVVIQRQQRHPALKLLTIQSDLWGVLEAEGRAGLILHELIYEEMLGLGQNNSKNVRTFNAAISSSAFSHITASDYQALVQKFFVVPDAISFKMDRFTYFVPQGNSTRIDLKDLVATTESNLKWNLFGVFPSWIRLSNDNILEIAPPVDVTGIHTFDLSASSEFYSTAAPAQVIVLENNNYPATWLVPGIIANRSVPSKTIDISMLATDIEHDQLKFWKVAGPEWVNVAEDGKLSYEIPEGNEETETVWLAVSDGRFRSLLQMNF